MLSTDLNILYRVIFVVGMRKYEVKVMILLIS